ncbi:hypothetical protein [Leadbetterella sp. DM7]|uniref:hypothetical protein n=1 Tax=Leadbetterella sp. DM7 TaxID=3235085 RepID=UPI00349E6366
MDNLPKKFLESGLSDNVKTYMGLSDLFKALHSKALESMLEGGLDAHLGYDKHQKSSNPIIRYFNTRYY